ncbi:hypothetical protein EGN72_06770 [Pseudorhodobacter sp. E13]|uniref:hypothetical protein n=1 Tax=Pseudorhodobacter sp. E13 TaxID=2487931 RepID=UPI000F8EB6B5|nr:hypothetical protein [Pseudorhodobacter sp. E13]RUS60880.1 hypothetical protein EGN72_06770 [Pseudorhodobacter sp. E13]
MARFRVWLWRLAMLASMGMALFFAWFSIAPFETVGDPTFDTVIWRARAWEGGPVFAQLAGVVAWLLSALMAGRWGRGLLCLSAGGMQFLCLLAMANEYGSLIQYGDLRDAYDIAAHKLMVSRVLTLGLALGSLALGALARSGHVRG